MARVRTHVYARALMSPILVQPRPGQRISGGYLYNARMAEHGAWEILSIGADELEQGLRQIDRGLVIADSLWLSEQTVAPFLALPERGVRLAFMMHSFPSMIAAAESGWAPCRRPTPFELETLERVGLVIVPGSHYAEMLRGDGIDVAICEPGIDDAWRAPPRRRSGPCSLVSVGALTPRKGFRDVLEALRLARPRTGFRWTVIGSLSADARYAERVRELATEFEGISFVGQMPPEDVRRLVIASDLLVMPSYDENHPLVLLEATAASVPAVSYGAGAAALMLGHGALGLVGPIGDRAVLGRNVARLIDDESERYRLAEACWEAQRRIPSWRAAAANARRALEQIRP